MTQQLHLYSTVVFITFAFDFHFLFDNTYIQYTSIYNRIILRVCTYNIYTLDDILGRKLGKFICSSLCTVVVHHLVHHKEYIQNIYGICIFLLSVPLSFVRAFGSSTRGLGFGFGFGFGFGSLHNEYICVVGKVDSSMLLFYSRVYCIYIRVCIYL